MIQIISYGSGYKNMSAYLLMPLQTFKTYMRESHANARARKISLVSATKRICQINLEFEIITNLNGFVSRNNC